MTAFLVRLYRKAGRREPMEDRRCLAMTQRWGIEGDASADERSPRQVLLVGTSAVTTLGVPAAGLRGNLLVEGVGVDTIAPGTELQVGEARLRVSVPCEPCQLLQTDTGLSPWAAAGLRGVLATVVRSGEVCVGDPFKIVRPPQGPTLPVDRRERVRWLVRRIPRGYSATYGDLARAAGLPPSSARALPRKLHAHHDSLPVHRVVGTDLRRMDANQKEKLRDEGVTAPLTNRWSWSDVLYGAVTSPYWCGR